MRRTMRDERWNKAESKRDWTSLLISAPLDIFNENVLQSCKKKKEKNNTKNTQLSLLLYVILIRCPICNSTVQFTYKYKKNIKKFYAKYFVKHFSHVSTFPVSITFIIITFYAPTDRGEHVKTSFYRKIWNISIIKLNWRNSAGLSSIYFLCIARENKC